MKLVSPEVLVPLKFEPFEVWTTSYGTNSWALEDRQVISMVFSLQFDHIGLSTAEGKRKFSLIWLIASWVCSGSNVYMTGLNGQEFLCLPVTKKIVSDQIANPEFLPDVFVSYAFRLLSNFIFQNIGNVVAMAWKKPSVLFFFVFWERSHLKSRAQSLEAKK